MKHLHENLLYATSAADNNAISPVGRTPALRSQDRANDCYLNLKTRLVAQIFLKLSFKSSIARRIDHLSILPGYLCLPIRYSKRILTEELNERTLGCAQSSGLRCVQMALIRLLKC